MKHTPGPWRGLFAETIRIIDGKRHTLAIVTNVSHFKRREREEVEANARLIAAAPELLEKLKITTEWMEWWLGEDYCDCDSHHICGRHEREKELEQIRAVIAKAEEEVQA